MEVIGGTMMYCVVCSKKTVHEFVQHGAFVFKKCVCCERQKEKERLLQE
jgi:hypothetical protein